MPERPGLRMIECDYAIVGSGAGGGTLAARLAEAGMRVVLLEAGEDHGAEAERMPEDYEVPAFHPLASEHPAMSWKFFVKHYASEERQKADPKWHPDPLSKAPSVYYPRAAALGGCTAHNAMIFVAPHESDWDGIARITGDGSWSAKNMRQYLRRVQDCRYRHLRRFLNRIFRPLIGAKPDPWLSIEVAAPLKAARDKRLTALLIETYSLVSRSIRRDRLSAWLKNPFVHQAWDGLERAWKILRFAPWRALEKLALDSFIPEVFASLDPNGWRCLRRRAEGPCLVPLTTRRGQRAGARERLLEATRRNPGLLRIEYNALATKVVFDSAKRAIGVKFKRGARLYRAHDDPSTEAGKDDEVRVAREVILAGGAFNTAQLLMLSGIGPEKILHRWQIPVVKILEGVGQNLQDRYEVGVIYRLSKDWEALKGAKFRRGDRLFGDWRARPVLPFLPAGWQGQWQRGMYVSNGAAAAFTRRSSAGLPDPDLFILGLLAKFRGYYPGYSAKDVCNPNHLNYLTWAILKAHTVNRAGTVTLRSADPRDPPEINFHYFEEGDDGADMDLDAVVKGIRLVRNIAQDLNGLGLIEELPGEHKKSDADLAQYVRDTAWGHHASCTCPIGPARLGGVLSSDFTVHGTKGLRIADASIFPRIPGFFIASAIYMIAEKAADVILQEARGACA